MQPTLAILHMQPPSWGGFVAARAHCGVLSVVTCPTAGGSIGGSSGASSSSSSSKARTLFTVNLLPHDAFRVIAPPDPLGSGALVVSTNALHFIQVSERSEVGMDGGRDA